MNDSVRTLSKCWMVSQQRGQDFGMDKERHAHSPVTVTGREGIRKLELLANVQA